jgi:RNA polymerase sigma-70 factor (ECF subfamily)
VEFLSVDPTREDTGVPTSDPLRPLLDAAAEGDDHAVAELVRRTQPDVWRLCVALGSTGEEQDLVQETYLRALGSLASYRGDAPVRAWLLSIARHVCADHVRRRERQRRLLDRVRPHPLDAVSPAHTSIDDLLAELTTDRREAFVLTQMLGLSYEEAAATLGCPIGTVRSRVARARADLAAEVRRIQAI